MTHSRQDNPIIMCDQARTAQLLAFPLLVDSIANAAIELDTNAIMSPARMVVPMGPGGVMLSMPAIAADIGIHKLVNVQLGNVARKLPTINGIVAVCDGETGQIKCLLDGPEVTGRRTAAVTLLAIRTLLKEEPKSILLYGTGVQARYHVQALYALYPHAKVWIRGRDLDTACAFCKNHHALNPNLVPNGGALPAEYDVVITLTTSTEPVYNEPGKPGRLVIGVGAFKPEMAEIGKVTLASSTVFADDPVGARHEAGDLIRAGVDWTTVRSLAAALRGEIEVSHPAVFKSVGTGAWDLAAARVAWLALNT